jgi:hypothetical protein
MIAHLNAVEGLGTHFLACKLESAPIFAADTGGGAFAVSVSTFCPKTEAENSNEIQNINNLKIFRINMILSKKNIQKTLQN